MKIVDKIQEYDFSELEIGKEIATVLELAEKALAPFAEYGDPSKRVFSDHIISKGSPIAKPQLTMGDCYNAHDVLMLLRNCKSS